MMTAAPRILVDNTSFAPGLCKALVILPKSVNPRAFRWGGAAKGDDYRVYEGVGPRVKLGGFTPYLAVAGGIVIMG